MNDKSAAAKIEKAGLLIGMFLGFFCATFKEHQHTIQTIGPTIQNISLCNGVITRSQKEIRHSRMKKESYLARELQQMTYHFLHPRVYS